MAELLISVITELSTTDVCMLAIVASMINRDNELDRSIVK
jgi:hypothetical protein